MVAVTTLACAMVEIAIPEASIKARWSKAGGSGLLFSPPPRRSLPLLVIYVCQIVIESYIVSKKNGDQV